MTNEELAYNQGWNDALQMVLDSLPAALKPIRRAVPAMTFDGEPVEDVEDAVQWQPLPPPPSDAQQQPAPVGIPLEDLQKMPVLPVSIPRPGGG